MRPDKKLAGLLGLIDAASTLATAYMRVDAHGARPGIVTDTMQFHGAADRYGLTRCHCAGDAVHAPSTATSAPAVTPRSGRSGGAASVFTYDLARSVILTRQGNPAWAGKNGTARRRAARRPVLRLAAGDNQPNWVDLNKASIPQADEQQRLLANLIVTVTCDTSRSRASGTCRVGTRRGHHDR